MMNKAQADIAYGFVAINRADPAYYAYWLMNNMLGQYALGGRLGDSIRERQGMAYYVFSALDANVGEGPLTIRAGVNPANVDRAVDSIDEEIVAAVSPGFTDRGSRESQRYLIGSMPRSLETNVGIAEVPADRPSSSVWASTTTCACPGCSSAVTREEVQAAAERVLATSRATVVIAGPYQDHGPMRSPVTRAVFFDVDFTLIYPGPTFQGEGYRRFCARHGVDGGSGRASTDAVRGASFLLDEAQEALYDPQIFIHYTRHIIETMGGSGPGVDACAREIYEEWAACQHFLAVRRRAGVLLQTLAARDVKIGLISNTHRCLTSFQAHFELEGLIAAAISSSEHGYMKPHPSIFEKGLQLVNVEPRRGGDGRRQPAGRTSTARVASACAPCSSSDRGTRAACREGNAGRPSIDGVPVIRTLAELPALLWPRRGDLR